MCALERTSYVHMFARFARFARFVLSLFLGAILGMFGCSIQHDTKAQARRIALLETEQANLGRRLLFEDAQGMLLMKWRVRAQKIKVYDRDMIPVGQVRWDGGARNWNKLMILDRAHNTQDWFKKVDERSYVFGSKLVFERQVQSDTWRIYNTQRALLGVVSRNTAGQLVYRSTLGGEPSHWVDTKAYTLHEVESRTKVASDMSDIEQGVMVSIRQPRKSWAYPEVLIVFALEAAVSITPLERTALAMVCVKLFGADARN